MPITSVAWSPPSSASVCCPAPSEGVLVTAPEKMPRITPSGTSMPRCRATTSTPLSATMAMATPLRRSPLCRSDAKKPGPTWLPMV